MVPNERSSGVTFPPLPRIKRLYKVNSVVPSVMRVVRRKNELLVTKDTSPADLPSTFLKAVGSGKQPVLRPLASTSGLPEYSPLRLSARLSSTSAGAVQILIFVNAPGNAVT